MLCQRVPQIACAIYIDVLTPNKSNTYTTLGWARSECLATDSGLTDENEMESGSATVDVRRATAQRFAQHCGTVVQGNRVAGVLFMLSVDSQEQL